MTNTISDDYLRLQQELHADPKYGTTSLTFAPAIAELMRSRGLKTLSDYGAGKQNLLKGLQDQLTRNVTASLGPQQGLQ